MLNSALVVLAFAAVGGLVLASGALRHGAAAWALSLVHGLLALAGLGLVGMTLSQGATSQRVTIGFLLLVVAAFVGFLLAAFHFGRHVPPKVIVLLHASAAVAGVLMLFSLML